MILRELTKTFLWLIGSVFTLLTITFFLDLYNPVDVVLAIAGENAPQEVYDNVKKSLNLHDNVWMRYFIYVKKSFSLDFGRSLLTHIPIVDDLKRLLPVTLSLATLGVLFGVLLGVPVGAVSAFYRTRWIERVLRTSIIIGHSIPGFLIAYGLLALFVFFKVETRAFCEDGPFFLNYLFQGNFRMALEAWTVLWPAALVLGIIGASFMARMTRNFFMQELNEPYVLTAQIKGAKVMRLIFTHIWPNIRGRFLCIVLLAYTQLVEGSVITETVFALPGCGSYITQAILNHDFYAILGTTLVLGSIIIGLNSIVDMINLVVGKKDEVKS